MKTSAKQIALTVLCIVILFIPTYIAIAYFSISSASSGSNRYLLDITAHTGKLIYVDPNESDSVASAVLKMNSKLTPIENVDASTLPDKFYDIKVNDNGTVSKYRYYFSVDESRQTLVTDANGRFYSLDFKDTKAFLSKECSYMFYETARFPVLSISGGSDIFPKHGEWRYRAVNGTLIDAPVTTSKTDSDSYAMSGHNKLSFSIEPTKCLIKVLRDGDELLRVSELDDIPYDTLDSASLSFVIEAEWTGDSFRGSAEYRFFTVIGQAPEFFVNTTTVQSGEFFTVTATNVSAPQKIEFSSMPDIHFDPVFFADGDLVHALIPIDKELSAPMDYTFTFKYGDAVCELGVSVTARSIITHDNYNSRVIGVSRSEENIAEYQKLLEEIGSKYEEHRYFGSERFINYEEYYTGVSQIILGFGHKRVPNNGDETYRLDGVDFEMIDGYDVPAIAAGKVVYSGSSALLGNFIVVDHGLGLKTWYCHLGNALSAPGEIVAKGEVIGKAGKTGYTNISGVYLITTVMDVPVSPYPIQDLGISFKNP